MLGSAINLGGHDGAVSPEQRSEIHGGGAVREDSRSTRVFSYAKPSVRLSRPRPLSAPAQKPALLRHAVPLEKFDEVLVALAGRPPQRIHLVIGRHVGLSPRRKEQFRDGHLCPPMTAKCSDWKPSPSVASDVGTPGQKHPHDFLVSAAGCRVQLRRMAEDQGADVGRAQGGSSMICP